MIFTGDPLDICATLGPLGLWTGDPNGDSANLSDYIGFDTLVPPETGAAPLAAAPGPPDAGESYQRCPEGPAAGYQSSGGLLERHTACTDNGALAAKSPGADKTGAQFTGCDGQDDTACEEVQVPAFTQLGLYLMPLFVMLAGLLAIRRRSQAVE